LAPKANAPGWHQERLDGLFVLALLREFVRKGGEKLHRPPELLWNLMTGIAAGLIVALIVWFLAVVF
jgi:hypothetical protein